MTLVAVAAGGALGALTRYLLAVRVYGWLGIAFPWGTMGVNILGSLLLGVVIALIEERGLFSPEERAFLTIGFLGGMTTFSTFVYEGWEFTRDGELLRAGAYSALSLVGAFTAFVLGHALVRMLDH